MVSSVLRHKRRKQSSTTGSQGEHDGPRVLQREEHLQPRAADPADLLSRGGQAVQHAGEVPPPGGLLVLPLPGGFRGRESPHVHPARTS